MKHLVAILLALFVVSGASAADQMKVTVFDKNGVEIALSTAEIEAIKQRLPTVVVIEARYQEAARAGGTNMTVLFQIKDGKWYDTSFGVNGNRRPPDYIVPGILEEIK